MKKIILIFIVTMSMSAFASSEDEVSFEGDQQNATVIQEHQDSSGNKTTTVRQGKTKTNRGPRRVGEIYEGDKDIVRNRIHTLPFTTFEFGPAAVTKVDNSAMFYAVALGKNWDVNEKAEIRADLYGAIASKNSGSFVMGGLGGSFFFSTSDVSPLLGGELGFGTASGGAESATSFAGEIHVGIRFFRTAETQMSVEGYYRTIFTSAAPAVAGAQLAIHF